MFAFVQFATIGAQGGEKKTLSCLSLWLQSHQVAA